MPQPKKKPTTNIKRFDLPSGAGDDLYINDGASYEDQYYDIPAERKEAEREKAAVIQSSLPVIKDVHDWFETAIDLCDSLDNIQTRQITINDVKVDVNVSIEAQLYAYQLLKQLLTDKQAEFKEFAEGVE